ncbi:DNA-binding domain-containing protein [Zavarzinia compransoris]|uniref:HvfC/BufC family peptide modification chaperone n=1 Tax=Zavarzinia marina TaxID=2911065 RepID=UPI001F41BBB8|nr:putative DNA-binding domain-containing protein [Zavarzinia marina]MCF4164973.1 DNA-binding domain-containing protein [Zavarzinia marina]
MLLADFQARFAASLRGGTADPALLALIGGGGVPAANRLSLHRNHVRTTLSAALALHFPVVACLVGEAGFAALATRFIADCPPDDPRLALFGARFPGFLARLPELAALPMVAEVAAFEWARHRAALAPAVAPFEAMRLASMGPDAIDALRLALLPGVSIVETAHAVDHIWEINQAGRDGTPGRTIAESRRLLVWRDGAGAIRAADLGVGDAAFLRALAPAAGALGPALDAALDAEADADPGAILARPLGLGLLCLHDDVQSLGDLP